MHAELPKLADSVEAGDLSNFLLEGSTKWACFLGVVFSLDLPSDSGFKDDFLKSFMDFCWEEESL